MAGISRVMEGGPVGEPSHAPVVSMMKSEMFKMYGPDTSVGKKKKFTVSSSTVTSVANVDVASSVHAGAVGS